LNIARELEKSGKSESINLHHNSQSPSLVMEPQPQPQQPVNPDPQPQPQPQQPYRATWGTNNKGGRVLIDDKGFSYLILRAAKENQPRSYWKCKDRVKHCCKATGI